MTTQPEPDQRSPDGPGRGESGVEPPGAAAPAARPARPWRRRGRLTAFGTLLTAGLIGLAIAAVGIAHQLLPRQFTPAQQRAISAWEVQRRWRTLPAGKIFPPSVPYQLSPGLLNASTGMTLRARLLGISPATSCARAVTGPAVRVLRMHGCSVALRATYVDASGSLVATVAVAVLPSTAAASTAAGELSQAAAGSAVLVRALAIARTPAAGFRTRQRQLGFAAGARSYVIMATAGFADDRRQVDLTADNYLHSELTSMVHGLIGNAKSVLGGRPATPVCPGAPGC